MHKIVTGKPTGMKSLDKLMRRYEDNTEMGLREIWWKVFARRE